MRHFTVLARQDRTRADTNGAVLVSSLSVAQIRHKRKSTAVTSVISTSIFSPRVTFEDLQLVRIDSRVNACLDSPPVLKFS